jgi:hypothetical protein
MKRTLQILTHKGMINDEFICRMAGLPAGRQAAAVTAKK